MGVVPQWPVGGWHPGEPMSSGLWPLGTLGTDPRSMQPWRPLGRSVVVYMEPAAPKALRRGVAWVGSVTLRGSPITSGRVGDIAVSPVLTTTWLAVGN